MELARVRLYVPQSIVPVRPGDVEVVIRRSVSIESTIVQPTKDIFNNALRGLTISKGVGPLSPLEPVKPLKHSIIRIAKWIGRIELDTSSDVVHLWTLRRAPKLNGRHL